MSKKHSLAKRVFASAVTGAILMSLMTGCDDSFQKKETSESGTSSQSSSVEKTEVKSKFGGNIAVKSEHYTMSLPMIRRIFNNNYNEFLSYYASYYNFDTTKSMKLQYYDEEKGITWYDTFIEQAKNDVKYLFTLSEAALKDGMELSESELESISSSIQSMQETAEKDGMTFEEYLSKNFGNGLTKEDVEENMKETTLAQKYYNKVYHGFTYSDEQYEETYNESKSSYQYVDFLNFTFAYDSADNADEKDKAKAYAQDLAKCKTPDEFKEYVRKYLTDHPAQVTVSSDSSDDSESSYTEEEFNEAVDKMVDSLLNEKYTYEVTTEAGKWLFDDGRKVNDTYFFEGTSSYTVVMLAKTAYRDESINKNVRHILFTSSTYGSDAEAKKKAEEVYKEWQDGDATEESFGTLATKYNADSDPNSAASGGLYENVYQGQMVKEFNDWVFDESRKSGDTGIVKTTYGYHIMYFVGDSKAAWKQSVDTVMRRNDFNELYNSLTEQFTVEFDDDYINTIADMLDEEDEEESKAGEESTVIEESKVSEESKVREESTVSESSDNSQ